MKHNFRLRHVLCLVSPKGTLPQSDVYFTLFLVFPSSAEKNVRCEDFPSCVKGANVA